MQNEGESGFVSVARVQARILSLTFTRGDLQALGRRHLLYGLLVVWAVGLGRYWDHPDPYLVQALGLGSLAVLVALAGFLYLALLPLRPARWSFVHLLTFLSLTALPALLYAIPVERGIDLASARVVNAWFLGVVAVWRVGMLARYLSVWTGLSGPVLAAALLLPLALVVVALTLLNLEQAVFNVMAGLREDGTPGDVAYLVLFLITGTSFAVSPVLALLYAFAIWQRAKAARNAA